MGILQAIQEGTRNVITWAMGTVDSDPLEAAHIARQKALTDLMAYYNGHQRKPLKVTMLGKDYNVITNHAKVIVDRSVSMLVGPGITFDLPGEEETEQDQYINAIWDANHKDILLHDLCQFGGIYGTPAIKIIPNGQMSMTGNVTHRLVAINPYNLTIHTAPDDIQNVRAYVFRWQDGQVAYREVTEKQDNGNWKVYIQKSDRDTHGRWQTIDEQDWQYSFAPIAHSKNLPNAGNVYGCSDIEGLIDLQDKYNEGQSNINKILALQAFAQKWVTGGKFPRSTDKDGNSYIDAGPDKSLEIAGENAKVGILQPDADMSSSRQFVNDIKTDLYDISATVDANTVKDKVGALTNFGLRVLYKNELAKIDTKQLLYGDLLLQVNNRLLQLNEWTGEDSDPGKVVWGNPLPTNDTEEIATLQAEKNMGIVSPETIAKKRGYNYEDEQGRLKASASNTANVGGNLIKDFLAGRGQQ